MSNIKLLIIILIGVFHVSITHAQTSDTISKESNYIYDSFEQENNYINTAIDYKHSSEWKRYKTLRAIGWSSLGIGIPTTLVGVLLSAFQNSLSGSGGVGIPCIVTGGVLTLSSIPLLACAYHYRKKALNLTVGVSSINVKYPYSFSEFSPALSFAVSF